MKIGIDARLWDETGVGRYIRNLTVYLQKIDTENEYVVFVKDAKKISPLIISPRFSVREVNIHWHSLKEQLLFAQVLDKQTLDLMHFPYFSLPILYKKPFVVTIHDLIIHQFATGKASTLPLPLYSVKRLGFKKVFQHALKKSEKIIVPLENIKKEIHNNFLISEDKIAVTTEGFDTAIQARGSASEDTLHKMEKGKYFLYVGNAYPHKNVGFLLKAFMKFNTLHPEYRLILVGKDDYFYKELRSVTSSSCVSFLHDVSDTDLGQLYTHSQAFVSASLMEGFGLPPLESMGSGSLVVVSDIPSFKEVWGDSELYFDPQDEESLVEALSSIITLSPEEKKARREKGTTRVKQFSWEKMAEKTVQIYESSTRI
jgi:glycosyltransferase involved in cell wall biosynthesis